MLHSIIPSNSTNRRSFDVKSQTSTEGEDFQYTHNHPTQNYVVQTFKGGSSKTKTSLCKNYIQKNFCPYADKCQFAHGAHELRINMQHNKSYKTKGCHAFSKKGCCSFGQRCNFIHERSNQWTDQKSKWSLIYANHRQTLNQIRQGIQQSRLLNLLRL